MLSHVAPVLGLHAASMAVLFVEGGVASGPGGHEVGDCVMSCVTVNIGHLPVGRMDDKGEMTSENVDRIAKAMGDVIHMVIPKFKLH